MAQPGEGGGPTCSRIFSMADQRAFAGLSGDYNPMHVDPVAARRLLFGKVVVHGLHGLLWAMEACCARLAAPIALRSARVRFCGPIGVGDEEVAAIAFPKVGCVELTILAEEEVKTTAFLEFMPVTWKWSAAVKPREDFSTGEDCRELTFEQASTDRGRIPLVLNPLAWTRAFPNLAAGLPMLQAAQLLAITRLVGMHCPGRHSLLCDLEFCFTPASPVAPELAYAVASADGRTGKLVLHIESPGMVGMLRTFLRPRPAVQASMADVARRVRPDEFKECRALIIGGTRGLGETTAKLLAAGGASVRLTYHQGRADGERVAHEIAKAGGEAGVFHLDVTARPLDLRDSLAGWMPTHLFYFATPRIRRGRPGTFSPTLFNTFCQYYVEGFYETVAAVRALTARPLIIVYPSTVFLDDPKTDFGEYVAAKAAGERLGVHLQRILPGVSVHRPRLPRLKTDQVVGLLPVSAAEPIEVLLAMIRSLRVREGVRG